MSIESDLQGLATTAPAEVEPQALMEAGLADGYVSHPGPVGPMWVGFNTRGISAVHLSESAEEFEEWFRAFYKRDVFPAAELPDVLSRRLEKALATGRVGNLPIDWESMSPFQQKVLKKAVEILPGEVRPYSWIAREIGQPKASRAVGTALARNPIPFLLPCHRVVRNDGSLGNYYYGPDMKREILGVEGLDTDALDDRISRHIQLTGSDTTKIYCHPTCRDARRVTTKHKVEFRNREAAVAAGYRPCKHCRP